MSTAITVLNLWKTYGDVAAVSAGGRLIAVGAPAGLMTLLAEQRVTLVDLPVCKASFEEVFFELAAGVSRTPWEQIR